MLELVENLFALSCGFFLGYFAIPLIFEKVFRVRFRMPLVIRRMIMLVMNPLRSFILWMQQHYYSIRC